MSEEDRRKISLVNAEFIPDPLRRDEAAQQRDPVEISGVLLLTLAPLVRVFAQIPHGASQTKTYVSKPRFIGAWRAMRQTQRIIEAMFWWFKRKDDLLRYEARQLPSGEFEFCVVDEHGNERVERFTDGDALHARQLEFEKSLKEDGWTGPHGWNL